MASDTYLLYLHKNYTPADRYFGTYPVPTLENTRSANPIELENPATPGLGSIKSQSWLKWSVAKRSRNPRHFANQTGPRIGNRPDTGHGFLDPWVFFKCKLSHASRRRIFYNIYGFDYLISDYYLFFFFYQGSANLCKDIRFWYLCA
jgi:hypothetical protein